MKKEIIISIIIVILVVILNIITENYTKNTMSELTSTLNTLKEDIKNENEEAIRENMQKSIDIWNDRKEKLMYYIEHNELEKVEMHILEIQSYIETEEYNMAIEVLDSCKFVIEHIEEKYAFCLKNIF